jgi:hypothetical protein
MRAAVPTDRNEVPSHQSNNAVVVSDKLASLAGVREFEHYAIIVGVCGYGSPGKPLPKELETHSLLHPCNNAWEFANLLIHDYHYKPKNIVLMVDDPANVDRPKLSPMPELNFSPTRTELTKVIENWSKVHDSGQKRMTLVIYYSGHGAVFSSEDAGLPYLQLANWEADIRAGLPRDVAGFPMDRITKLVKVGIPAAKHVLYLFDNCHAGWALSMGETERAELQRRWADGITYGIAASSKEQSAWEPGENSKGLSAFTETLIKGLELRANSAALADGDDECGSPDHVVTHAELESYLRTNVPKVVAKMTSSQQVPVGHRFDGEGQFLLVAPDAEQHLSKRTCAKPP